MKKIVVPIQAPQEGINQLSSINVLKDTESQTLDNVDIDSKLGCISTRDLAEYLSVAGPLPSGLEVLAIHFYEKTDGTFYLIATDGVNVYASLSGTTAWGTAINVSQPFTSSKPIPWFLNVDGKLWITNGYDTVKQWDSSTYKALTFVPKGELMVYDKSRVIMIKIAGSPLSVRFSQPIIAGVYIPPDDPQAWPATEELIAPAAYGAGLTGIALLKGLITQQGVSQGRVLLFKDSSMYTLFGKDMSDFRFDLLSASVGTRYPRSVEYLEDGSVAFAGELGLYRTDGEEVKRFSDKVENSYNLLSRRIVSVGSTTFSQNFNTWVHTNTEVSEGGLHLSGTNLTGSAVSPNTNIITTTVLDFLACLIQSFSDSTDTVLVELKTAAIEGDLAAAAYATIEDSEVPTNTILPWIKVRVSFIRTTTSTDPVCTVVQVNYESYVALKREPFMVYDSDELIFGFDQDYQNLRLVLNRFGAWTIDREDSVLISCGTRYRGGKYLGASNGRVYSLYSEENTHTLAISSEWTTKPITCGFPDKLKSLDYIVVFSEGSPFKRCTIDFLVDGSLRKTQEFINSGQNLRELKLWISQGLLFKTLELTFRTTSDQQISLIGRVDLHTRLIESEEAN